MFTNLLHLFTIIRPRVLKIMRVLRLKFRGEEISSVAKQTIAFNYLLEGLKMEVDQVESIKKIELLKLRSLRKLCLVLDLDHTLLHTVDRGIW